ncbi:hypothetical protein CK203_049456 [Vitis vinifera]|uniref:Uncharacterized protein n=1 Tax=Vitis vinifera TaxID=29760 RepID=A0A438HAX8_VITVI|nr:hypothetical protein CK203_049456 [Vitis vinifera]
MAKTRGGLSASPPSRCLDQHSPPSEAPLRHLLRPPPFPPSEGGTPSQLRAIPGTSGGPPTKDSQVPVGIPLKTVIRRPMIVGPPIEGNLDCRDRSFHSETWFDIELSDSSQSSGIHSVCYKRYHMEHLLTPRKFYYPRVVLDFYQSMTTRGVRNPTLIYFTIDGHQGIIGACHIAEALRIPYEPVTQADFKEWSSFSPRDMVHILSRGTSTTSVLTRRELPSGMLLIDGYYFGPHHLIMTYLLHFEEKVHQRKLQRADVIPLLFPRLLCQILEHPGLSWRARLERRCHCLEDFSLDKWHHLAATLHLRGPSCAPPQGAPVVPPPQRAPDVLHLQSYTQDEQLPQAQQDEILTDIAPPVPAAHTLVHMPEATLPTSPITQGAPPVVPATSAPPPSSEPTVTISLTEFRGLVHSLQTLSTAQDSLSQQMATIRAHQDLIIATQTQHTTILHQIQQHLSMQTLPGA